MIQAVRQATTVWEGDLPHGQGQITPGSGFAKALPVTWASRVERSDGKTSPEELIASAHASCYAMALTLTLTQEGNTPERVQVKASCTLGEFNGAPRITTMVLDVLGTVPGMDNAAFVAAARKAEQLCPVSNALRNNVKITVNAQIEQGSFS